MTRLSIWNDLRPFSVGFDELFDHFNNTLEYTVKQPTSYPPYNINKLDDFNYQIEMGPLETISVKVILKLKQLIIN